ncbi:MAG: hypothetical protein ACOY0T_01515 [Myxococcota bacterium]
MGEVVDLGCSLAGLARKYRALLALRSGEQAFDRQLLRKLAEEFPGALRELDALPLPELQQRLAAVRENETELPFWIEWMLGYHREMRLALAVRRSLAGVRRPSPELSDHVARAHGVSCDAAFVRAVADPPGGRLNALVFARLAARFERSATEIEGRLFRAEERP